jgi:hypothetical protein
MSEATIERAANSAVDDFFHDAVPTQAFLKAGIIGGAGDGKTYTSALIAIGLHKLLVSRGLMEATRPVALLESSEFGVDWIIPMFEAANIPLKHKKSKAFRDFSIGMRRAADAGMICMVDSVTGYWVELVESHRMALNRVDLMMEDWAALKMLWGQTMEDFKNLPGHIILAGRAGFEYARFENEATGRMELERTGVRMKAEGETGYEPSLLVFLKKAFDMTDPARPRIYHTATILKDRSQAIHGQTFDNPTFETFLPHISRINLGGKHIGVGDENSRFMVTDPRSGRNWFEEKTCVLDEIDTLLANSIPGMSADDKKRRGDLLLKHFQTLSRERLRTLSVPTLQRGYKSLHVELVGTEPTIPGKLPTAPPEGNPDSPLTELADRFAQPEAAAPAAAAPSNGNGSAAPAAPAAPDTVEDKIRAAAEPAAEVEAPPIRRRGRPKKAQAASTIGEAPAPMDKPAENTPGATQKEAQSEADLAAEREERNRRTLAAATAPAEAAPPIKRGRGRPRKDPLAGATPSPLPALPKPMQRAVASGESRTVDTSTAQAPPADASATPAVKRGRGRPKGAKNKKTAEASNGEAAAAPTNGQESAPDVGNWSVFLPEATRAAAAQGITGSRFNTGMNLTLTNARLMAVSHDKLPREFLLDLYDAIVEGRWNPESGTFQAAPAPFPNHDLPEITSGTLTVTVV